MNAARCLAVAALVLGTYTYVQAATPAAPGLYARAELGKSWARNAHFRDDDPASANCFLIGVTAPRCTGELNQLGSGWTGGVGIGYSFANRFRADIGYNRRQGYNLTGADPAGTIFDPDVKSDTVMVNGTFDLPIMLGSFKPFIGAGIGRTRNEMKPLNWNAPGCCTGTLTGGKKNDLAWQLTVGAEIAIGGGFTLEVLYRYTSLGKFVKATGPDQATPAGPFNPSGITGSATGKLRTDEVIFALRRSF